MSVFIQPHTLRHELARRGLSAKDLARSSGVSAATISTAMTGRAISARSLQLIANALARIPIDEVIDVLLSKGTDTNALGES